MTDQPIVATLQVTADTTRTAIGLLGAFLTRWANDPATSPSFADYPEVASLHHCSIDVGTGPASEGVRFEP